MKALNLPDGDLFYELKGSGPALLFLHAGVADSRMWDAHFDFFGDHFQAVRCDLRGYGRSLLPDGPFAYHDDVSALVETLNLAPSWLVAASFGASVAVDFTLTYPELVKGLVLVSPVVSGFVPVAEVAQFAAEEDALLEAGKLAEATELNLRMWVDGPNNPVGRVDPAIRKQVAMMQLRAFSQPEPKHVSLNRLDPPAIERLEEIKQPVLILSGALDAPEFLRLAESVAGRIPRSTRQLVPEVAHLLNMEVPEHFNQMVLQFASAESDKD